MSRFSFPEPMAGQSGQPRPHRKARVLNAVGCAALAVFALLTGLATGIVALGIIGVVLGVICLGLVIAAVVH